MAEDTTAGDICAAKVGRCACVRFFTSNAHTAAGSHFDRAGSRVSPSSPPFFCTIFPLFSFSLFCTNSHERCMIAPLWPLHNPKKRNRKRERDTAIALCPSNSSRHFRLISSQTAANGCRHAAEHCPANVAEHMCVACVYVRARVCCVCVGDVRLCPMLCVQCTLAFTRHASPPFAAALCLSRRRRRVPTAGAAAFE